MEIGRVLKCLSGALERDFNAMLSEYDLTVAQIDILHMVYEMNRRGVKVNQRAIEQALHLKNPTVTGTLNRLEAKGFIVRRPDPRDGRSKLIETTPMEQAMREKIVADRKKTSARLLHGFTDEEVRAFEEYLGRAFDNMTGG